MKKLLFAISLILSAQLVYSQTWQKIYSYNEYLGLKSDSVWLPPQDTLASAPVGSFAYKNGNNYTKTALGYWVKVNGTGGGLTQIFGYWPIVIKSGDSVSADTSSVGLATRYYLSQNYYPNTNPQGFIALTGISGVSPINYNNTTGVFTLGNVPVNNLNGGVGASSTTFWRGDGTWGTPPGGIASGGGLSPLFTNSVSGSTLNFQFNNVLPYGFFGRASGTGVPSWIYTLDSNWAPSLHSQGYYDGRYQQILTLPLSVANGGTGTASPGLVAGTNVTITGTWPNQTISSSGGSGGGTTTNALTFNNGGAGAISGTTFNGSTAQAISYNTIGAQPTMYNDINQLPQLKQTIYLKGYNASSYVTNYSYTTIDSLNHMLTPTGGGWVVLSTSGDSIQLISPYWVIFGNSIVAGHPWRNAPLEVANLNYADSFGTISYRLTQLMNMQVKNRGWGGQYISTNMRARFMRDVIGYYPSGSNSDDSWGSTPTLLAKPAGAILEGGVNDVYLGQTALQIENAMTWMAQTCQQYGIPCVMLNLVGDSTYTYAQREEITIVNQWLAAGNLKPFNCVVVDINSLWNAPNGPKDNAVYSSLVNSGDKVHFTQAGYDSVAKFIFQQANLPVLTKMIFGSVVSPTNPITSFKHPSAITVNGTAYSLPNANLDTIAITAPIKDTMWVKITASTGTGTQSGFNYIAAIQDNNPSNKLMYTQTPVFNGALGSDIIANSVTIQAPYTTSTLVPVLNIPLAYGVSGNGFQVFTGNSAYALLNTSSKVNVNDIFSVGGQLSASSNILSQGYLSSGQMDYGFSGANPALRNYGIGVYNTALRYVTLGNTSGPSFQYALVNSYTTLNSGWQAANLNSGIIATGLGFGNNGTGPDTLSTLYNSIPLNQTNVMNPNSYYGVSFNRLNVTSAANGITFNQWNSSQSNYFNTVKDGGRFGIGAIIPLQATNLYGNMTSPASTNFYSADTTRGVRFNPMTTAQRNNIGGVKVVTITTPGTGYSTPPTCTVTGGTGTGIRIGCYSAGGVPVLSILDPGYGYGNGNTLTGTVTGGTGSSLAFTVTTGIDSGLMIFNTDLLRYQQWTGSQWVNIGDATRTAVSDAAYTMLASDKLIAYTAITASRAVTLPATTNLNVGQEFQIVDESGNASGSNTITIVGTVNGVTNPTAINSAYGSYKIYWTGTKWVTK